MDYKKVNQLPMFFVVGVPRSGTTMLQQMLDANPAIVTPLECWVLITLKQKYFKKKNWTKADVSEFIEDLYKDPMFVKGWNIDRTHLTDIYESIPLNEMKYELLLKLAYYSYPSIYDKNEIKILGDKTPGYTTFVDDIKEIFPDARFIHIIRDYRANILSNRKWFLRKKIPILAHKWMIGNRFVEQEKVKFPKDFYTVRYEDLVDDPEKYAREITSFLGVEYNQSMIDFHKKAHEVYIDPNAKVATIFHKNLVETLHENIIKPINKDKVNTWKQELTQTEIALADYICIEYAKNYGYAAMFSERSFSMWKGSAFARIRIEFDVLVIRNYQKCPSWVRKIFRIFSVSLYKYLGIKHIFNREINRTRIQDLKKSK